MLSSPGGKQTILVVEDDHALRELYRAILIAAGYAVVAVEDGIDALRYVDGHTPNLIVLDLALPRLRGQDVQRELASRADTRHIPIVVVTGTDTQDLRYTDFDRVLSKPVSSDTLLAAIERGLRTVPHSRGTAVTVARTSSSSRYSLRTVLVVDDEVSVQRLLRDFLEARGYSVKTAGSVGDAISVLEHSIIDAVVLDVRMPKRSGLELLKLIRLDKNRRNFPVMILTGATLRPDEEAAIARDAGGVFYKPDGIDALAAQLDRLTSQKSGYV